VPRIRNAPPGKGIVVQRDDRKLRLLFLCTGNSCRSQMAEGWARHLKSNSLLAFSAGIEPVALNQLAVRAMAEAGVDISQQQSKHLNQLKDVSFDYVITVCDHANKACPVFLGPTTVIHVPFDDPPLLARDAKSEEQAMRHYRRVRDDIRRFIETLPDALTGTSA